ncbi:MULTISPECIES: hypothetical protein [unclassified Ruegeria]|uniref:hypothetical protein n=1 Tax=unclassified Ruegeria TaxID=2625375 RepID=UPI0020C4BBE1|nr:MULTISPECIES: hypothetical protein [unclassified Ruegeria]
MKASNFFSFSCLLAISTAAFILSAGTAQAYVGPGLGLGTIAVVLGVIGSIFLAIFAIIWYPAKRILRKRRAAGSESESDKEAK